MAVAGALVTFGVYSFLWTARTGVAVTTVLDGSTSPVITGQAQTGEAFAALNVARQLLLDAGQHWEAGKRIYASLSLREPLAFSAEAAQEEHLQALKTEVFLPAHWDEKTWSKREPKPIMVFLHGRGESGQFDVMNSQSLPRLLGGDDRTDGLHRDANLSFVRDWPFITLMPQCPAWCATQNGWSHSELDAVSELVEATVRELGGDPKRVYLTGQSMGGSGAWEFGAYKPEMFAAVLPMCGYCPAHLHGDDCGMQIANPLRDKPIWIFHGENDMVIPVSASDDMAKILRTLGNTRLKYSRPPVAPAPPDPLYATLQGHAVYDMAFLEPGLAEWLLQWKTDWQPSDDPWTPVGAQRPDEAAP
ncbi:unnamed protein product [Polarella glacialis]|uniref:Feruloyl esterase n=1 Tax=Polarella glacialis TaxID=89957 RepID=A0A813JNW7_POLGL|nr:unnamed protein product [Polarella glacialis]